MPDIMDQVVNKSIHCLDKGHVTLVDVMPRVVPEGKTADFAIVQAARVSYGEGTKTVNEDRGLIRYLLRHAHTTPLEMVTFKLGGTVIGVLPSPKTGCPLPVCNTPSTVTCKSPRRVKARSPLGACTPNTV
mgnify:CR=1 FL=1